MNFVGLGVQECFRDTFGALISKLLLDFYYVVEFLGYLIFLDLCNCRFLSIGLLLHKRITHFVIFETY